MSLGDDWLREENEERERATRKPARLGEGQAGPPEDDFTSRALRLVTADNPVSAVAAALRASETALAEMTASRDSHLAAWVKTRGYQDKAESSLATMTKERDFFRERMEVAAITRQELDTIGLIERERLASRAEATKAERERDEARQSAEHFILQTGELREKLRIAGEVEKALRATHKQHCGLEYCPVLEAEAAHVAAIRAPRLPESTASEGHHTHTIGCWNPACAPSSPPPPSEEPSLERVATLNGRPIIPPAHEHIRSRIVSDRECLMFGCGFMFPEPTREEPSR